MDRLKLYYRHVFLTCPLDEAAVLTRVLDGEGLVVRGQHAVLQLQGRARVCTRVLSIIIGCSLILSRVRYYLAQINTA